MGYIIEFNAVAMLRLFSAALDLDATRVIGKKPASMFAQIVPSAAAIRQDRPQISAWPGCISNIRCSIQRSQSMAAPENDEIHS